MTKAYIRKTCNGMVLKLTGHADRVKGEEINLCCAGLSMLSATALEAVSRLADAGKLQNLKMINKPGNVRISAAAMDENIEELHAVCDTISAGIDLLKAKYPGNFIGGEI